MRNLFVMLFLAILGVTEAPVALDSYVLRVGDSTTINGNFDEAGTLRMQERFGSRYFWFKRDGQAYVVSDAKVIERASAIVQPQRDLGLKQGALGRKQGALGEKQAALGMKQAALGMRQAGAWQDDALREQLSREQEALSRQQEALGAQQEALGREQEKLGAEQERISEQIEEQLSDLADECIRKGVAKKD
jgi:bla regulator protein blaR1